MADEQSICEPIDQLADSFLARYRRGERPSFTEYIERCPSLADEIRELFPALVLMEELGPREANGPVPFGGKLTADGRLLECLGDYRILREIGRGGMGVVYEAEQESLGRHVALKVLPYTVASDSSRLKRFRREARSAARLHHSNIVPVFEVGEHDGIHYYAMQFIQGQGLDEVLREVKRLRRARQPSEPERTVAAVDGPRDSQRAGARRPQECGTGAVLSGVLAGALLSGQFRAPAEPSSSEQAAASEPSEFGSRISPGDMRQRSAVLSGPVEPSEFSTQSSFHYYRSVARVGLQIAQALDYAHGEGVLHRDIKPSNVLLDAKGLAWVTDFGLAKEEGQDLTRTGDLVGTLRYMAPERFRGISDARSDVYSLGVTLYEILTLKPAFEESDRGQLVRRVTQEEPIGARKHDPRIPADLETIVLKAIEKEPARRYQTAADMADDLARFLADRPILARRSSWAERSWRWCRRNPVVAGLGGVTALLLVVIAFGASAAALVLSKGLKRAERAERQRTEQLAKAYLEQGRARRLSRQPGQRVESLAALRKAAGLIRALHLEDRHLAEIRNEAIACLVLPDLSVARQWHDLPPGSEGIAFDGAMALYACSDKSGNITVRRVADDSDVASFEGSGVLRMPDLSPDGRFLAAATAPAGPLEVYRLDQGKRVPFHEARLLDDWDFEFAADSSRLVYFVDRRHFEVLDLATGRTQVLSLQNEFSGGMAFHPDGGQVAYGARDGKNWLVQVHDISQDTIRSSLPQPFKAQPLAWHPGGTLLAVDGADGRICLWNVARRERTLVLEGHKNAGIRVAFNHAGTRLASNDWDHLLRVWDTCIGTKLFTMPAGFGRRPHFSQDDRLLAADVSNPDVRLLRFHSGREFRMLGRGPLLGQQEYLSEYRAIPSPDGRLVANRTRNGISLLDLSSGEERAFIPGPETVPLLFEPSGALMTHGATGVLRWPLRIDKASGKRRFGPPERVFPITTNVDRHGASRDGRVLVLPNYNRGALLVRDTAPDEPLQLGPQDDVRSCALSPDGRWVATGSHETLQPAAVKVWNARTGQLVTELPVPKYCAVGFSPDGRWLATTGAGCRLWSVGSWRPGPVLGEDRFAFTPDSKLIAVTRKPNIIRLIELDTGKEIAQLTAPDGACMVPLCFSTDGSQLIAERRENRALYAWDLRSIRTQLNDLGLDWEQPPYPPGDEHPSKPFQVEVELADSPGFGRGDLSSSPVQARDSYSRVLAQNPADFRAYLHRGWQEFRLRDWRPALDDFSAALRVLPACEKLSSLWALPFNHTAWMNLQGPDELRDLDKALALGQMAVQLEPGEPAWWNTLGVVYYRCGKHAQAIESLERSLHASRESESLAAFDLFYLAMCHQRTGQPARAREYYDQASAWWKAQRGLPRPRDVELRKLHNEAAALLGPSEPAGHGGAGKTAAPQ